MNLPRDIIRTQENGEARSEEYVFPLLLFFYSLLTPLPPGWHNGILQHAHRTGGQASRWVEDQHLLYRIGMRVP